MKEVLRRIPGVGGSRSIADGLRNPPPSSATGHWLHFFCALAVVVGLMNLTIPAAVAQESSPQRNVALEGRVLNSAGHPVGDAFVRLQPEHAPAALQTKTNAEGVFVISALEKGSYLLTAEKAGLRSRTSAVVVSSPGEQKQIDVVLEDSLPAHADSSTAATPSKQVMEFADKPSFTVAGVTDWTAAGGHGSDTSLRTSEDLTRETLALEANSEGHNAACLTCDAHPTSEAEGTLRAAVDGAPGSFEANRKLGEFYLRAGRYKESVSQLQTAYGIDPANRDNEYQLAQAMKGAGDFSHARDHVQKLLATADTADLHRLAGELDEKLDDPLAAVHEFEQAIHRDPSEENYFAWGSELLLHRAILQAQQVFQDAAKVYPRSARILTALGTALFASAHYEEAALRLCDASDLNPTDPSPYIFMGRIDMVAPNPLACVRQKLARFVQEQPDNSLANYFYAMAMWKGQAETPDRQVFQHVETLLAKAVAIDPKCGEAYLQLGILSSTQHNFGQAIGYYLKAIEARPELVEAHYRLGVAYDRTGDPEKARHEFQLHEDLMKQQAAEIDHQRREVKQFLVDGQPTYPVAH